MSNVYNINCEGSIDVNLPRILITAPSSGSGKTTVTCGILEALKRRGLKVSAFKCGPDYIDPMFHKTVLGLPSKNLDSYLADEDVLKKLFAESAAKADISVVEGVMGYYDGAGFDTVAASTYEVGKIINAPVVLVVNAKGMALSVAAMLEGFINFKKDSSIKAVILNRVTKITYLQLKPVIEKRLGIKVLGFMPESAECQLESRHLGLVTPSELDDIKQKINEAANLVEENIDIDMLISIANEHERFEYNFSDDCIDEHNENNIKIAVAYDKAFCFYYEDNFRLLKRLGARLEFFSPLTDKHIPDGCDGLLLGGGYPEIYAKQLSENKRMLYSVKSAVQNNMPCVAECGGFLYLHHEIEDLEHNLYKMADVIDAKAVYTGKLSRFGYIDVCLSDSQMYGEAGEMCRGHEFHYYDSEINGVNAIAVKPSKKRQWQCMIGNDFMEAGFPHLFYYSNIQFAKNFVAACETYKNKRKKRGLHNE